MSPTAVLLPGNMWDARLWRGGGAVAVAVEMAVQAPGPFGCAFEHWLANNELEFS